MGAKRIRRSLKLEWNIAKDTDDFLFSRLMKLKRERRMLPTIRKALLLYFSLEDGSMDILREEFPELIEFLMAEGAHSERESQSNELAAQASTLTEKIINFEDMLKQMSSGPPDRFKSFGGVPRISAPKPDDDDDDLVQATKRKSDGQSARNFLKALDALNSAGHTRDDLKPSKSVSSEPRRPKRSKKKAAKPAKKQVKAAPSGEGNAKKMDVPDFVLPVIEDDDDDDFAMLIKPSSGD